MVRTIFLQLRMLLVKLLGTLSTDIFQKLVLFKCPIRGSQKFLEMLLCTLCTVFFSKRKKNSSVWA